MAMETLAMLDMAMVLDTGDSMERERLRPSPSLLVPMAMVLVLAIPTMLLLEPAETTLELPFPANL